VASWCVSGRSRRRGLGRWRMRVGNPELGEDAGHVVPDGFLAEGRAALRSRGWAGRKRSGRGCRALGSSGGEGMRLAAASRGEEVAHPLRERGTEITSPATTATTARTMSSEAAPLRNHPGSHRGRTRTPRPRRTIATNSDTSPMDCVGSCHLPCPMFIFSAVSVSESEPAASFRRVSAPDLVRGPGDGRA
jgi:hypothetical protein